MGHGRLQVSRYIQDFKATKRKFKNEAEPVVFVGFPVTRITGGQPPCEAV